MILHRKCIRISSSRRPAMCLFHVVLRRIDVTNTCLMRLFSSSTRSVMCLFRVVLWRKYLLNTPVLWRKYVRKSCILLHKCGSSTSSTCLVMCFFRAVLWRKNVTNVSLMCLSLIRPVIYCFRAILSQKYSLNTAARTPQARSVDGRIFGVSTGSVSIDTDRQPSQ